MNRASQGLLQQGDHAGKPAAAVSGNPASESARQPAPKGPVGIPVFTDAEIEALRAEFEAEQLGHLGLYLG